MILLVHGPLALLAPGPAGAALAPSLERPAPWMPGISRQPGSPAQTGSSHEMCRSVSNDEGRRAVMTARAVVFDIGGVLALTPDLTREAAPSGHDAAPAGNRLSVHQVRDNILLNSCQQLLGIPPIDRPLAFFLPGVPSAPRGGPGQ